MGITAGKLIAMQENQQIGGYNESDECAQIARVLFAARNRAGYQRDEVYYRLRVTMGSEAPSTTTIANYEGAGKLPKQMQIACDIPWSADRLRHANFVSTMSLVRASVFPGWDESLSRLQDWDVWLNLLSRGIGGVYVPKRMFVTGEAGDGVTASTDWDTAAGEIRRKWL